MKKTIIIVGVAMFIGVVLANIKIAFADNTVGVSKAMLENMTRTEGGDDCDKTVFNINEKEDCDPNRKKIDCVSSSGNCCRKTSIGKKC